MDHRHRALARHRDRKAISDHHRRRYARDRGRLTIGPLGGVGIRGPRRRRDPGPVNLMAPGHGDAEAVLERAPVPDHVRRLRADRGAHVEAGVRSGRATAPARGEQGAGPGQVDGDVIAGGAERRG
jgi:hypothetical protein